MENPVLIFIAAIIFHFFADTLLHWNIYPWKYKKYPFHYVALDVFGGAIAAYIIMGQASFFTIPVWAAIIGGNMPDVLHGLWEFTHNQHKEKYLSKFKKFFVWHDHLQLETLNITHGLIAQAILITVSLILL